MRLVYIYHSGFVVEAENLKGMDWNSEYLNSLLTVLEALSTI